MGAWGYGPMENDCALDWIAEFAEKPILTAIECALRDFSSAADPDDIQKSEAEAAAALLLDLTTTPSLMRYSKVDFIFNAKKKDLFNLAIAAITRLIDDKDWLAEWNDPEKKFQMLNELLSELKNR
ncbi:MAG TPA: DUF4259 domain-containing protein [Gemmataceae bacterium]|jgi:hypothetical protein